VSRRNWQLGWAPTVPPDAPFFAFPTPLDRSDQPRFRSTANYSATDRMREGSRGELFNRLLT
jgi:hypothetical protein